MVKKTHGDWRKQPDGTYRLIDCFTVDGLGSGWGLCPVDAQLPTSRRGWLQHLSDLVGAASKVDECTADHDQRRDLNSPPCPVLCMLISTIRCGRMVKSERDRLRIARLALPTPPELRRTAAQSFCELIVKVVESRCTWLQRHFVKHTNSSLKLPTEEQLRYESNQICEQFEAVSQRWKFEPIDAAKWMNLIQLELSKCDWMTEHEQTIEQTIAPDKADDNAKTLRTRKPWTELANDLMNKWFTEMKKKGQWIPRKRFLNDFLTGKEGERNKWKGLNATTEDKRFQDNPDKWQTESETLKTSFRSNAKNGR